MKAMVEWQDGVCFRAQSGSGHEILMDGPPDHGGRDRGARPMETVLMGLGGCSSFDVVHILRKARQEVSACRCELSAERAEGEIPAVFTKIHLHFVISGPNLKESHVQRAVSLSAEKYCSAAIMLSRGGVEVTHSHTIESR